MCHSLVPLRQIIISRKLAGGDEVFSLLDIGDGCRKLEVVVTATQHKYRCFSIGIFSPTGTIGVNVHFKAVVSQIVQQGYRRNAKCQQRIITGFLDGNKIGWNAGSKSKHGLIRIRLCQVVITGPLNGCNNIIATCHRDGWPRGKL